MFPPVYQALRTTAVIAIVGDRIAPNGEIEQDASRPYVTWFVVSGQPHDNLSDAPPSDFITVQIDCWHADAKGIVTLASAVRDALDAELICNRIRLNMREEAPDGTRLYRIGLEADFIEQRDSA